MDNFHYDNPKRKKEFQESEKCNTCIIKVVGTISLGKSRDNK